MKEERMEILNMLKEGKIDPEEAERLLRALESGGDEEPGRRRGPQDEWDPMPFKDFGRMFRRLGRHVGHTMKSAFEGMGPIGEMEEYFDDVSDYESVPIDPDGVSVEAPFSLTIRQPKDRRAAGSDVHVQASHTDRLVIDADGEAVLKRRGSAYVLTIMDDCDILVPDQCESVSIGLLDGDVAAGRLAVPLKANTMSGDIDLLDVVLNGSCHTMSGDVTARVVETRGRSTGVSTMSGDIALQISDAWRGRIDATTMSGDIDIHLPAATVERKSGPVGSRYRAVLGPTDGADAVIACKTMSGDISVTGFEAEDTHNADAE